MSKDHGPIVLFVMVLVILLMPISFEGYRYISDKIKYSEAEMEWIDGGWLSRSMVDRLKSLGWRLDGEQLSAIEANEMFAKIQNNE